MTTNWLYEGKEITSIEDIPNHESVIGFTYKITNLTNGRYYIGKKVLFHNKKTRISKTEKEKTKTRCIFKMVKRESDWKKYYGSSDELKKDVKELGKENFKREIIMLCCNKKYLSYCEMSSLILNDVLRDNSYNANILGKYYARDLENCPQPEDAI